MDARLGIIGAQEGGVFSVRALSTLASVAALALAGVTGCSGGTSGPDDSPTAADDSSTSESSSSALSSTEPVGSTLQTVANLNLRTGAGTDHSVILVIPDGATVTLKSATPIRGWYYVSYGGHLGYSAGQYLVLASSSGGGGGGGGTTSTAATARAGAWVAAGMPYCGGVNFGADAICGGTCRRYGAADTSAWNSYRSDCSGLVSYSWGLAAPGLTTAGFAPFDTSASYEIDGSELRPGDALNSVPEEHIILFAGWANESQGQANIIEEYDCGHDATAHVLTLELGSGSSSVSIPDWEPHSYRAIRKR